MDDMGTFRTTIGVENLVQDGNVEKVQDVLVDTGSEFTWLPAPVLERLGIKRQRVQRFRVADGRLVERDIGFAMIHAGDTYGPDAVVFGEPNDAVLIGVICLETLNLRIDLANKRLIDAGPILTAVAA